MPRIRLTRAPDAGAILRRMRFDIDGRPVARLRRGESTYVEVPAGTHEVRVRMDWLRSAPVRLHLTDGAALVAVTAAVTEHSSTFTGMFLRPRTALELRTD